MPHSHTSTTQDTSQLLKYKQRIDTDIAAYRDQLIAQTGAEFGPYSKQAMEAFVSLLSRGGKRLRGALVMVSYDMFGGTNQQVAITAARATEILHAYMLVVDDVCDRSELRRGDATVHVQLADYHATQQLGGDSAHFGVATALSVSLVGNYLAMNELLSLPVSAEVKQQALTLVCESLAVTGHGQINDIFNEAVRMVSEEQVQRTLTWKTAYYSFLNPLQLGAVLAGTPVKDLASLHEYAAHMGLAFQITDDIIGTFGDESKSGKSAQEDVKEGKVTILVSYAYEKANQRQRIVLDTALGNAALTQQQYEQYKQAIEDTGALAHATNMAAEHVQLALSALHQAPKHWDADGIAFLRDIAHYVAARKA